MNDFSVKVDRILLTLVLAGVFSGYATSDDRSTTVGLPQTIEQFVLPGSELTVRPLEDRNAPLVLRIIASYPHGTDHRYDLEYTALEPGQYNLADYLQRADGSPVGELPEVLVDVASTLPEGQVLPTGASSARIPFFGGYRIAAALGTFAWVMGLFTLVFWGRKSKTLTGAVKATPVDPIDEIRQVVEKACQGELPPEQRGELERAVFAFWRDELKVEDYSPAELSEKLRGHEQAGPMLKSFEQWLHAPEGDETINLASVLEPIETRLRQRNAQDQSERPVVEESTA